MKEQLEHLIQSSTLLRPEVLLLALLLVFILLASFSVKNKPLLYSLAAIGLILTAGLNTELLHVSSQSKTLSFFHGLMVMDATGIAACFLILACFSVFFLSNFSFQEKKNQQPEVFALSFSMLLASFLAVKTTHFLTIVLSVELISICSYVLTNLNRSSKASEASLKFLLFGASATALMLFGLSFIYGLTGSLNLDMLQYSESFRTQSPLLFHFAWLLFLSGIFFKLTLVPFHFWAPDAYEGTSTPVVGLFSVLPKIVGSLLLFRIVQALSLPLLEHTLLPGLLQRVLAAIALLSITWGNILAFRQKEIKRMMAYSTISQSGLIAGAAMLGTGAGLHSLLFYLAVYLLMNFGQFQLLILAENLGAETKFKDFYGKGKMHPALGVWAVILALALTGLPITAGFSGKLFVFSAIWRQFTATGSAEFAILVAGGILNTVLALFYYIKLPYVMFFKDGEKNNWLITRRLDHSLIALFCSPLILFFIKPDWLLSVIESLVPIF